MNSIYEKLALAVEAVVAVAATTFCLLLVLSIPAGIVAALLPDAWGDVIRTGISWVWDSILEPLVMAGVLVVGVVFACGLAIGILVWIAEMVGWLWARYARRLRIGRVAERVVVRLWRWARKDRSVHWHGFEEKGGRAARS